jgi:hypothetical protein
MDARLSGLFIQYRHQSVYVIPGGYYCEIDEKDIAIDADGAPNAYGPPTGPGDHDGSGIDSLTAANYPPGQDDPMGQEDWKTILVPDPANPQVPFRKPDGFFISRTSLCDETRTDFEPGKFLDATAVSYIVMPSFWLDQLGLKLGDLCLLNHTGIGRVVVAIVGDVCPVTEPLGEISVRTAVNLGGQGVSPRTGVTFTPTGKIQCVMLKGSQPDALWPAADARLQALLPNLLRDRLGAKPIGEIAALVVKNDEPPA